MNIYSQYIEDFVDQSTVIPRDIIRISKLIEEIDHTSIKINKKLNENRRIYLQNKRIKADKTEELKDLKELINKDCKIVLELNQQKLENINEMEFLSKIFLEELSSVAQKYEKDFASENWNIKENENNTNNISFRNEKDNFKSLSSRLKLPQNSFSSLRNGTFSSRKLPPIQKKEPILPLNSDFNEYNNFPIEESNSLYFGQESNLQEVENEKYCTCQGVSYGDMIECDSQSCKYKWFHFKCVGLEHEPEGKWYCSAECENKQKKKKRRNH
jgi:hypothetical protein